MKIKSIFTLLLSALLCIGCSEEQVLGNYTDLNLSSSYISISEEGETIEVTLTSPNEWEFSKEKDKKGNDAYPIPSWLTISQTEGQAGQTVISFSAEASKSGREVELKINSGNRCLFLKVRQGEMTSSPASCKQVNEAPDGKNFTVSGTITKIANTTYGNWYMNDGTADLYIYGTLDAEGKTKNFASLGLEVGDKVTIEGPKSTYNGQAQMVDVTVKKIEKALLKVVTPSMEVSKEGGKLEILLATKGKGAYFSIAEECQTWVSYDNVEHRKGIPTKTEPNPADTVAYTFNILPNEASARQCTINFFADEGEPIPFSFIQEENVVLNLESKVSNISKDGGELKIVISTEETDVTYTISEDAQEWITFKNEERIVSEGNDTLVYYFDVLPNDASARIGNIVFSASIGVPLEYTFTQAGNITDVTVAEFLEAEVNDAAQYRIVGHVTGFNNYNNNFYLKDWSGEVYAYKVETQGIKDIAIGDFVTVVGTRSEYKGTPQLPKGTLLEKHTASPEVSVAEFLTKEDSKEVYYKLTGTITSIAKPTYGNIYITDANGDEVYVYGLLPGYGATGDAKQGLVDAKGLKVGDTITIVGNKASYNGSPQVGNAVYLSHESVESDTENNETEENEAE